jgi:FtsZ-binding cell division protein ZapB
LPATVRAFLLELVLPRLEDITNDGLGKLLSLEFLAMMMALAVSWGVVTTKVDAVESQVADNKRERLIEIDELKAQTTALSNNVNQINRKVDVLGNNQDHFKKQNDSLDKRMDKMLEILEKPSK